MRTDPREMKVELTLNLKDVHRAYDFIPEDDSRTILGPAVIYIVSGGLEGTRAVVISDGQIVMRRR